MNPATIVNGLGPTGFRRFLNLTPQMRATGSRVVDISDDWMHWELVMKRGLRNMNYVGTIFGGAVYGGADPHYMLAMLHIMGPDYIVWDKAATIHFKRPGRTRLHGEVHIDQETIDEIKATLERKRSVDHTFHFTWHDAAGDVVAEIEKVLYFRKKAQSSESGTV